MSFQVKATGEVNQVGEARLDCVVARAAGRAIARLATALAMLALAAVGALAVLQAPGAETLGSAASASAADGQCPNAELRTGSSSHLPECRAYELVSPPRKLGNPVLGSVSASPDGNRVTFRALGAFEDAVSNIAGNYVAHRSGGGWRTFSLNPPTLNGSTSPFDEPYLIGSSVDHSEFILDTQYPVDPLDQGRMGSAKSADLYQTAPGAGFEWLTPHHILPETERLQSGIEAATDDLGVVVFASEKAAHPDVSEDGVMHIYARAGGVTHLISRDVSGAPIAGGAGVGSESGGRINSGPSATVGGRFPSAVSEDASTVYFSADTEDFGPAQLYVRTGALDPDAGTTTLVSHSEISPDTGCSVVAPSFLAASQDGDLAYFHCRSALDAEDPGVGGIYAYHADSGDVELISSPNDGNFRGKLVATDASARHVYLASNLSLVPEAQDEQSLYLIENGELKLIAPLTTDSTTSLRARESEVSPDGSRLLFAATEQLVPEANGHRQIYLYDANADASSEAGKISCVSCPTDGSLSEGDAYMRESDDTLVGVSNHIHPWGNVAGQERIFFTSDDALVPEDRNGEADAYQYLNGKHHLLSTGQEESPSAFMGATADGETAYILTYESLTHDDVDNGVGDLYAVRIGGGYPAPSTPAPCTGEACRTDPSGAPPAPGAGTVEFEGPGNAEAARPSIALRVRPLRTAGMVARLGVAVSGAGRIAVRGPAVRRAGRRIRSAGGYRVPVRLNRRGARRLVRTGRLGSVVQVLFRQRGKQRIAARRVRLTFRRGERRIDRRGASRRFNRRADR